MNATERLAAVPEQERSTDETKEESMTVNRPATTRTVRRFEIGFFVRRIVNGWVVFYKQFPPEDRAAVHARETGHTREEIQSDEPVERPIMAMAHAGHRDAADGGATTQGGAGIGAGDGGPVGGTRVEVGAFGSTTTETTDGGLVA